MNHIMMSLASLSAQDKSRDFLEPVGNIGEFVQIIEATRGYVKHLRIGEKKRPLVEMTPEGIYIGKEFFSVSKNIRKEEHVITDYGLTWVCGKNSMRSSGTPSLRGVTLNHMGVCINSPDVEDMIIRIKKAVATTTHKLYEDPEGRNENMRWLFIGDNTSNAPMFEIVLPDASLNMPHHFQLDIDTTMTQEEIDTFFAEKFGKHELFDWSLSIDGVGKVLQMGTISNLDDIDFRLGIGNNKRDKIAHRESIVEIN